VELTGTRKAAMLLMTLDAGTAAELLKSANPQTVTEIAAEVAYLKATGWTPGGPDAEPAREFCGMLEQAGGAGPGSVFVQQVLEAALGPEQSREAMKQVEHLVEARDPFLAIRAADPEELSEALEGESPQVVAMVLAELPQKSSSKLLASMDDELRSAAIRGMAVGASATRETKVRVASVVRRRLEKLRAAGDANANAKLRRVAVLLRGLNAEMRNSMLQAIREQDEESAAGVQRMMVIWEDLPVVSDRSMQEALREVDSRQLALALVGADEATTRKIRDNMSERASAMLDEEASLLSSPSDDEVEAGRSALLDVLRELSVNGFLSFEGGA